MAKRNTRTADAVAPRPALRYAGGDVIDTGTSPLRINMVETIKAFGAELQDGLRDTFVPEVAKEQRPLNPSKVIRLLAAWDLRAMDPLQIAVRLDLNGARLVWEGQHRLTALHVGIMLLHDPDHDFPQRAAIMPMLNEARLALGLDRIAAAA